MNTRAKQDADETERVMEEERLKWARAKADRLGLSGDPAVEAGIRLLGAGVWKEAFLAGMKHASNVLERHLANDKS